jgi:outer membrane immunogenic protein
MIRKIILGGCAAFLLSAAAQAADITEPTAYDWTGPYVGIQGGYGWGENDLSANTIGGEVVALDAAAINGDDGSFDLEGFVGGAHAGFNWQRDSLLLGLESDIEYADLDGDTVIVGQLLGRDKVAVDWLGSLRLRAGFADDRALFYATGGLAVGGAKLRAEDGDGNKYADEAETEWGWTIGGGLEYALSDDLSARIEYRYTDLGSINVRNADSDVDDEADLAFHAVRAGLSWHFGGA